ncbi:hypothetical protein OG609_11560 [Streptomyces sp. NBC_01224]|uniref:hypothetical protein n=1 Tax=Streptomyces sp. NBC_01224 TaxID=2903783 RepID=UPI002E11A692|nr:hypothetical protein OG609_11560 [Streptomyces sp. NBC_01224]
MATVAPQPSPPAPPDDFADEIRALVEATAPRLFAVVEQFRTDCGEPDARVAAWGLAHNDGSAQVTAVDGGFRLSLRTPERAAQLVSLRPGSIGCLVWPEPTAATTHPS